MLEKFHALGRGGLGAVPGSKRLKALTVTSPGPRRSKGGPDFDRVRRAISKLATEDPVADAYRRLGTPMMVAALNEAGGFPTEYWSKGAAAHREDLEADNYGDWARVENETCPPCPVRCRRRLVFKDGRDDGRIVHGPEFETLYAFGGPCLVEHARDVVLLHEVAGLFVDYENRLFLHDCLIMCRFYRDFLPWEHLQVMISELSGSPVEQEESVALTGDLLTRIRRLNFAMGLSADDDNLPSRFFEEALGTKPPLDPQEFAATLRSYYLRLGWGETGDVLTGPSG